jgi:hypothetical protein
MDAHEIIEALGGTKAVQGLTGLSKGRISQMRTQNHIPRSWRLLFEEKRPDLFAKKRYKKRAPG